MYAKNLEDEKTQTSFWMPLLALRPDLTQKHFRSRYLDGFSITEPHLFSASFYNSFRTATETSWKGKGLCKCCKNHGEVVTGLTGNFKWKNKNLEVNILEVNRANHISSDGNISSLGVDVFPKCTAYKDLFYQAFKWWNKASISNQNQSMWLIKFRVYKSNYFSDGQGLHWWDL